MGINYVKRKTFKHNSNSTAIYEIFRYRKDYNTNLKIEISQDMGVAYLCLLHIYSHSSANNKPTCKKYDIINQLNFYVDGTNGVLYIEAPTYCTIYINGLKDIDIDLITIDKGNTITDVSDLKKV